MMKRSFSVVYLVVTYVINNFFFFSSRRRHTRWPRDWSSDVCSSDLYVCDSQDLDAFNQATINSDNRTCNIGSLLTSQKSNNASVFMRLPISPYWNAVYTFLSHLFYRAIFPLGLSLIESAYTLGRNTPW